MSPLNPISSGKIYTMGSVDFHGGDVIPTTPLNNSHPFCALWHSFLASLTDGCDSFWDPMMRIYTGQTAFAGNRTETERFKAIYLKNPPNVVIADMQSLTLYGRHRRLPHFWSFIYISKFYVNRWVAAKDEIVAMALEGLLKATLVHESAHWAQTLRVGLYPADLTQDHVDNLPSGEPGEQLRLKKKMTPKRSRAFWAPNASGEAGYYVELAVFGGILSIQDDKLIIATSVSSKKNTSPKAPNLNMVSIHALRELRNVGLCQLVSLAASLLTPQLPSPTPIGNRQGLPAMLCDSDASDEEELSWLYPFGVHCPREFPVLDILAAKCFRD